MPYLFSILGAIVAYNLVRWVLEVRLNIWPLQHSLWDLFVPMVISMLVIFCFIHPQVKQLYSEVFDKQSAYTRYWVMFLTLFFSLAISYSFIGMISHNIIRINDVNDIENYRKARFFDVKHKTIDNNNLRAYIETRESGKGQENFDIYVYLVAPFIDDKKVWLGEKYKKTMSNESSRRLKDKEIVHFISTAEADYLKKNLSSIDYFEKVKNIDNKQKYRYAIGRLSNKDIVLLAKQQPLSARIKSEFWRFFQGFGFGTLMVFIMVLRVKIDRNLLRRLYTSQIK